MDLKMLLVNGILFVVLTILFSIGADIVTNVQTGQTAGSAAYNVSGYGLAGMLKMGNQMPTLAVVLISAAIIGTLITYFAFK